MAALPFKAFAVIVGRLPNAPSNALPFAEYLTSLIWLKDPDSVVILPASFGSNHASVVVFAKVHGTLLGLLRPTTITSRTSRSGFPAAGLIHGGGRRSPSFGDAIYPALWERGGRHLANYEINCTGFPGCFDLAIKLSQAGVVVERCLHQRFMP